MLKTRRDSVGGGGGGKRDKWGDMENSNEISGSLQTERKRQLQIGRKGA